MTEPIALAEYADWHGALEAEDVHYILAELASQITVQRAIQGDGYLINPNQFVGVLTLPSGRRLESRPKVPIRNLFHMLAVALGLPPPFRQELAGYAKLDELLEFVVAYFAGLLEERIAHGLYRAYVEHEDNLATVRGRIAVAEDVRRNYATRHRTYCRYTEFTWDIPENQILRQVVHLLGNWGVRSELQLRLARLDATLAEVTPTHLPASAIDHFHYHRLNEDYRPLHQFCRLFLEGASVSEDAGPLDFQTFLVDMNKLFEAFVTQLLHERAYGRLSLRTQKPVRLGRDGKVPMQPDIVLRLGDTSVLVADCKYKRLAPGEFKNHDVYQLLAYCTATQVPQGVLVYPRHTLEIADTVQIANTRIHVHQLTIDLGQEGEAFSAECGRFADLLFALATAEPNVPSQVGMQAAAIR